MLEEQSVQKVNAFLNVLANISFKSQQTLLALQNGDVSCFRDQINSLRLTRAVFKDTFDAQILGISADLKAMLSNSDALAQEAQKNSAEVTKLDTWLAQMRIEFPQERLMATPENIDFLIDIHLPAVWNWSQDIVAVGPALAKQVVPLLLNRGQTHIIVLGRPHEANQRHTAANEEDLRAIIDEWKLTNEVRVCILMENTIDHSLASHLRELVKTKNMNLRTFSKFSKLWIENYLYNIPEINRSRGLKAVEQLIRKQKIILVSPGPSLAKNIELLPGLQNDHIVIAPVQSAQALGKHNIIPDFFIVVDPTDYSAVLSEFPCEKVPGGLIIMEACHNNFMRLPFKNRFIIEHSAIGSLTADLIGESFPIASGSSVSTSAAILAVTMGCKSLVLVGQDLSHGDRTYYFRSGFDDCTGPITGDANDPMLKERIPVMGWFGDTVHTRSDYKIYLEEFKLLATGFREHVELYNCTEGGAFIDGFSHMALAEYGAHGREAKVSKLWKLDSIDTQTHKERTLLCLAHLQTKIADLNRILDVTTQCIELLNDLPSADDQGLFTYEKRERDLNALLQDNLWLRSYLHENSQLQAKVAENISTLEMNKNSTLDYLFSIKDEALTLTNRVRASIESTERMLTLLK